MPLGLAGPDGERPIPWTDGWKRHGEPKKLLASAKPGLVYVSAFPDRATMARYLAVMAWETDVWIADAPAHLVHLNGTRFLGPY